MGLCNPKFHFSTPKSKCLSERNALGEHIIASSFLGCDQPRFIPCTAGAHENPNPWATSFLNIELQSLILPQKPPRFSLVWLLSAVLRHFLVLFHYAWGTKCLLLPSKNPNYAKEEVKGTLIMKDLLRPKKEQWSQQGLSETQKSFELPWNKNWKAVKKILMFLSFLPINSIFSFKKCSFLVVIPIYLQGSLALTFNCCKIRV